MQDRIKITTHRASSPAQLTASYKTNAGDTYLWIVNKSNIIHDGDCQYINVTNRSEYWFTVQQDIADDTIICIAERSDSVIQADIDWLLQQPHSAERDHIESVLRTFKSVSASTP